MGEVVYGNNNPDFDSCRHLAFKAPGQEGFICCNSLGDDYTEGAICGRVSGNGIVAPKQKIEPPTETVENKYKPNMLIDIQSKIQQGYSKGFEQFAALHSIKEYAKTLLFLQKCALDNYDAFVTKGRKVSSSYGAKETRIKEIEPHQKEISELQRQIGNYSKHRDAYIEYLRLKKIPLTKFQKLRKIEPGLRCTRRRKNILMSMDMSMIRSCRPSSF